MTEFLRIILIMYNLIENKIHLLCVVIRVDKKASQGPFDRPADKLLVSFHLKASWCLSTILVDNSLN